MASKRPDSDVWNIVDNDEMSQHYGRNFKFDFSYISSDEIKELFKDYVWQNYRVGNKTLSSLYREVNSYFYRFIQFAESRNIISLKGLTNVDVENYISYLHTTISEKTGKPYGISMQRHSLFALKSVIRWCQLHRPDDAPVTEIFTGSEYTGVNRKLKIDFIPDDVVAQINEALKTEENQYLKYGIIILQSTGMRIGDDDDKIRLNQRKPSKYKGLRRFGPEKNLQRINKFMKERPIFYKNLIQMKENIRFYLRCFYCITKVMILQFNSENRTELARNG